MSLTQAISLGIGQVATLINAATTTGDQQYFSPSPIYPARGVLTLIFSGTITTGTIDLEISLDNGTIWTKVGSTMDVAAAANRIQVLSNIMGGALYRLDIKTIGVGDTITATGIFN